MATLATAAAADIKTRYPVFAGVADATVTAILDEARGSVDDTWIEKDQVPALLALAAHLLVGAGALGQEDGYSAAGAPLASMRAGDHELKFVRGTGASEASGASSDGFTATPYGQRFLDLRRRSFPAVLVI